MIGGEEVMSDVTGGLATRGLGVPVPMAGGREDLACTITRAAYENYLANGMAAFRHAAR